jgi:hypothetical protein
LLDQQAKVKEGISYTMEHQYSNLSPHDNSLTFTIEHFNRKGYLIEVAICEVLMLDYALMITEINNELILEVGRKYFQF